MSEELEEEYLWIPTITQQKIVSLLVIIPSLLSFLGSSLIIYHVIHDRKKSPYRRILLGLSCFDIFATIAWISQPYLMTSNLVNSYVWSFGNETSCKAIAAIGQTGIASQIYTVCLSIYFLLTVRFGMREKTFEKRIEKVMHIFVITFSFGTGITGLVTDSYYATHVGPGCWISHPPEGDICANDSCGAEKMAWIFGGLPILVSILTIFISNLVLYCHVRSTVKRGQARALAMEERMAAYNRAQATGQQQDDDDQDDEEEDEIRKPSLGSRLSSRFSSISRSSLTSERPRSVLRSSDREWQRVKEVGKQSFLYVGSYFLCFIWGILKGSLDGQGFDKVEGSGTILFPLVVLQSFFLPIHGFFSCLIFFRPKYLATRKRYGSETRLWCMKKAILVDKVKPTAINTTITASDRSGLNQRRIDDARELDPEEVGEERSRVFRKSFKMVNPLDSKNESSVVSAVSATEDDQESVQSNGKKRSGNGKRVSYSDDPMPKLSAHSTSPIASVVEELEISDRETPPDTGSIDNDTLSQDKSIGSVGSARSVTHSGEIIEGDG